MLTLGCLIETVFSELILPCYPQQTRRTDTVKSMLISIKGLVGIEYSLKDK